MVGRGFGFLLWGKKPIFTGDLLVLRSLTCAYSFVTYNPENLMLDSHAINIVVLVEKKVPGKLLSVMNMQKNNSLVGCLIFIRTYTPPTNSDGTTRNTSFQRSVLQIAPVLGCQNMFFFKELSRPL